MSNTEAVLRHALQQNIAITLVVNKIDRLILELRMPPADAYFKIKSTIEEVNTFIRYVHMLQVAVCVDHFSAVALMPILSCASVQRGVTSVLLVRKWAIALL
jgi:translation elongation factor EF-G